MIITFDLLGNRGISSYACNIQGFVNFLSLNKVFILVLILISMFLR